MAHCNIAIARVPEKGTSILRTADIFKSALNLKLCKKNWRLGSDKVGMLALILVITMAVLLTARAV